MRNGHLSTRSRSIVIWKIQKTITPETAGTMWRSTPRADWCWPWCPGLGAREAEPNGEETVTDTDETRRKRSDAARKASLARSPESRRESALKGAATNPTGLSLTGLWSEFWCLGCQAYSREISKHLPRLGAPVRDGPARGHRDRDRPPEGRRRGAVAKAETVSDIPPSSARGPTPTCPAPRPRRSR